MVINSGKISKQIITSVRYGLTRHWGIETETFPCSSITFLPQKHVFVGRTCKEPKVRYAAGLHSEQNPWHEKSADDRTVWIAQIDDYLLPCPWSSKTNWFITRILDTVYQPVDGHMNPQTNQSSTKAVFSTSTGRTNVSKRKHTKLKLAENVEHSNPLGIPSTR